MSMQLYKIMWYDTNHDNKFMAENENVHVYYGDRNDCWRMWYELTVNKEYKHVEVYSPYNVLCEPEKGIYEMDNPY